MFDSTEQLAIFLSTASFTISIFTFAIQRIHYRQLVRPLCSIILEDRQSKIAVYIKNDGLGPMIIQELKIKYQDKVTNNIRRLIHPQIPRKKNNTYWHVAVRKGRVLQKEGYIPLFIFEKNETHESFPEIRDSYRKELAKMVIHVQYKDIYGKQFPEEKRTLEIFSRRKIYQE